LRNALKQQEFRLSFQPQVTDQGKLLGFEVLLRWHHPEQGLVHPSEFIAVAEETGLIVPIGMWVIRRVAEKLAIWSRDARTSALTLSVNVSARQFRDEEFLSQALQALRDTGLPHRRMTMELTESLLVEDIQQVIYKMKVLKSAGIAFSLDDFGTGYSSLSYLRRLPLDELKIDHSFFRNVLTEEADAAIVRTIVVLAQSLKLRLIAEGVETERQKAFLVSHGCRAYQGFLFGEAVPEEKLGECLNAWLPDERKSANS
jgi:EAL domain-containing protein (putative c-di-GMP-specific phosphodiesterase class I)